MLTRAPGKLVLSGAYAVLEGAPAIVCAVDRYVVADSDRTSRFVTPEFLAAAQGPAMPWFDATPLRQGDRKLGLGSSAAIVVAALGAVELSQQPDLPVERLRARVFPTALAAHRKAQGGGSGADVAASVHGGVLEVVVNADGQLGLEELELPPKLVLRAYFSGTPASTPALLQAVGALRARQPRSYAALLSTQAQAASDASAAVRRADVAALVIAFDAQCHALRALGQAAGAGIVDRSVDQLSALAHRENGCVLPAGAGGGDIVLFAGPRPPSDRFDTLAGELGHTALDLKLGAPGLHPAP